MQHSIEGRDWLTVHYLPAYARIPHPYRTRSLPSTNLISQPQSGVSQDQEPPMSHLAHFNAVNRCQISN